ncbi:hypothetical protein BAUCODRAFT_69889 [Baudoinia panamericana UAMH 10762]|uniref:G domain-containing protein n=1 Tax=Baudoinia panamericana (strain UAMH 10762) TaxID=717646 RepID=M2ND52_BAUPA|nr:uncharacterized protein BAUCODRAFT_69889 [Baudoinia panamericana UAMH 10762]EMC96850.1 hypothetical protein BAUCODRAFT_69889 [Baudoinia panamericana UAMH 10762]
MFKRLLVESVAAGPHCRAVCTNAGRAWSEGFAIPSRHQLRRWLDHDRRQFSCAHSSRQHIAPTARDGSILEVPASYALHSADRAKRLPTVCPGCGAHSQTVDEASPGYYNVRRGRNPVKKQKPASEDEIYQRALVSNSALGGIEGINDPSVPPSPPPRAVSICDRCHELMYHSKGNSVVHPSMQSIQAIIEESPHKHNHIYHVLDAADFPMSLIPNLQHALDLPRLRTQNRRSKSIRYLHDRVAEVSFIITRSDLLAPNKEQVDSLMPYLQEVLRDALGRSGRRIRLGNVRCVSAKRGWWTRNVKDDIWAKGGAGWMVGKTNVGKSALFEAVFPKGRNQNQDLNPDRLSLDEEDADEEVLIDAGDFSLLPPMQPETAYPVMPVVSALPGTTASPIRVPFGNGKGELIDLPGVYRSSLEDHIQDKHRKEIIMQSRVVPEQFTIRPGQSLLLGGLIRITPKLSEGLVMLAYPFVPAAFEPHVTATHKAVAIQTGVYSADSIDKEGETYTGTVTNIAKDDAKNQIANAGNFALEWNITKRRAGPLTDRAAGKQKADNLPFIVYGADILIESVGWVELVCQVRRRSESLLSADALGALELEAGGGSTIPEVEVFSPEGKYIGVRRPMSAWLLGGKRKVAVHKRKVRPRMSIGMLKRRQGGKGAVLAE